MPSRTSRTSLLLAIACAAALSGCVVARNTAGTALQPGQEATIAGRVVAIDMAPWAYDGNAVVQVATEAHGIVQVHLPARWNLCAAPAVAADALEVGDEVHVAGTVGQDRELVVCGGSHHHLQEID